MLATVVILDFKFIILLRFPPMRPRNTKEDHQVITKHRQIYPSQEELGSILKMAETVERALKRVSDKFANPDVSYFYTSRYFISMN